MNCCCCPGTGSHGKEDLCFQVDGGELKRRKAALMGAEGLHGCAPVCSPLTYHVIQLCLQGMIGTREDGDSWKAVNVPLPLPLAHPGLYKHVFIHVASGQMEH